MPPSPRAFGSFVRKNKRPAKSDATAARCRKRTELCKPSDDDDDEADEVRTVQNEQRTSRSFSANLAMDTAGNVNDLSIKKVDEEVAFEEEETQADHCAGPPSAASISKVANALVAQVPPSPPAVVAQKRIGKEEDIFPEALVDQVSPSLPLVVAGQRIDVATVVIKSASKAHQASTPPALHLPKGKPSVDKAPEAKPDQENAFKEAPMKEQPHQESLIKSIDNLFAHANKETVTVRDMIHSLEAEYDVKFEEPTKAIVKSHLLDLIKGTVEPTVEGRQAVALGKKSTARPQSKLNIPPRGIDPIEDPNENDVLCGRGRGRTYAHEGNVRYRDIINRNKICLAKTPNTLDRGHVAKSIVDEIRNMNPPGRFLEEDALDSLWYDIGDARATKKTSQALRDLASGIQPNLELMEENEEEESEEGGILSAGGEEQRQVSKLATPTSQAQSVHSLPLPTKSPTVLRGGSGGRGAGLGAGSGSGGRGRGGRGSSSKSSSAQKTSESKATDAIDESTPIKWFPGCVPLGLPDDMNLLSELQVYLRSNFVEAFAATESDIKERKFSGGKQITLGQVGIRCMHCREDPLKERGQQAATFPARICDIYQSVQRMIRLHVKCCTAMPPGVRKTIEILKESSSARIGGQKQYWIDSARRLGLVETTQGLHFGQEPYRPVPPLDSPLEESKAAAKKTGDKTVGTFKRAKQAGKEHGVAPEAAMNSQNVAPDDSYPLIVSEDKELISDYLYFTLEQMQPCQLTEADRVGSYKNREVGCHGLACKHCGGQAKCGRYFPASKASLSHLMKTQTIMNHVRNCPRCPIEVREQLELMERGRMGPDGKTVDMPKYRHGEPAEFFSRLWCRIQGPPMKEDDTTRLGTQVMSRSRLGTQVMSRTSSWHASMESDGSEEETDDPFMR